MTTPAAPTDVEVRLVEQYVRVLDFTSRCAQAIDTGNWHYLWAKTAQLEDAADGLARVAGETWEEIDAGRPRPRTEVVRRGGRPPRPPLPRRPTAAPHRPRPARG